MVGGKIASRRMDDARRRPKRLARKGGAMVARRLLSRKTVRFGLAPSPKDSGLQPVPGDKGLPILGHAPAVLLGMEFLESRLETYGDISWFHCFGKPFVLAFGPEAAQEVFANKRRSSHRKARSSFWVVSSSVD